jgi:hypothetical protein
MPKTVKLQDFLSVFEIPDFLKPWWELAYYERKHADQISNLKKEKPREQSLIYPEYILLHEAEALLERAMHIYLMPCSYQYFDTYRKKRVTF